MDTPQEITLFFDSLYEYVDQRKKTDDKLKTARKLERELELSRTANRTLTIDYKALLKTDNVNVNIKFVNLKATHDSVLKELNSLETKLQKLKIDIFEEKKRISLKTDQNIETTEELGKKRIQETKEQIEMRKLEHNKKVEQFNNELELAQAAADLEHDEIETTLRRELIDLNTKIWRQQKFNTELQLQIDEFTRRQKASSATKQIRVNENDGPVLSFFQLEQLDDLFENYSSIYPKSELLYNAQTIDSKSVLSYQQPAENINQKTQNNNYFNHTVLTQNITLKPLKICKKDNSIHSERKDQILIENGGGDSIISCKGKLNINESVTNRQFVFKGHSNNQLCESNLIAKFPFNQNNGNSCTNNVNNIVRPESCTQIFGDLHSQTHRYQQFKQNNGIGSSSATKSASIIIDRERNGFNATDEKMRKTTSIINNPDFSTNNNLQYNREQKSLQPSRQSSNNQENKIQNPELFGQIQIETNISIKQGNADNFAIKNILKKKRKESKVDKDLVYHTPIFGYSKMQSGVSKNIKETRKKTLVLQRTKDPLKDTMRGQSKKYETQRNSTEQTVQSSTKRQKLFNSDNLDYLDNMDLD